MPSIEDPNDGLKIYQIYYFYDKNDILEDGDKIEVLNNLKDKYEENY